MEQKWVIVGNELRFDKVSSYDDLIGENGDIVKCYGTFSIDHKNKEILFKVVPFFEKTSWTLDLSNVKVQGFYSPLIKDYEWNFSIDSNFERRSAILP